MGFIRENSDDDQSDDIEIEFEPWPFKNHFQNRNEDDYSENSNKEEEKNNVKLDKYGIKVKNDSSQKEDESDPKE